jgi:hypothetical protein
LIQVKSTKLKAFGDKEKSSKNVDETESELEEDE